MSESSSDRGGGVLGESPAVDITGKIMVVMIIVLFMFVVCFLFFHLYAKGFFFWRNNNNNNSLSRRRRDPLVLGTTTTTTTGGLDPLVLRSIPVLIFRNEQENAAADFGIVIPECSVCLSEFVEGEKMRLLPKCNHAFHVDCIDMWFQSHATCPLCRTLLSDQQSNTDNIIIASSSSSSSSSSHQQPQSQQSFPTNVLIWGNQNQNQNQNQIMTSSSSRDNQNTNGLMLVIDIPTTASDRVTSSSDEMQSPVMRTLMSMRRLLSINNRSLLSPSTSTSTHIEQPKPH